MNCSNSSASSTAAASTNTDKCCTSNGTKECSSNGCEKKLVSSTTNNQNIDDHDDGLFDADIIVETKNKQTKDDILAKMEFNALANVHENVGYREGASELVEQGRQSGFESTFATGSKIGYKWGLLRGLLECALRSYKESHSNTTNDENFHQAVSALKQLYASQDAKLFVQDEQQSLHILQDQIIQILTKLDSNINIPALLERSLIK